VSRERGGSLKQAAWTIVSAGRDGNTTPFDLQPRLLLTSRSAGWDCSAQLSAQLLSSRSAGWDCVWPITDVSAPTTRYDRRGRAYFPDSIFTGIVPVLISRISLGVLVSLSLSGCADDVPSVKAVAPAVSAAEAAVIKALTVAGAVVKLSATDGRSAVYVDMRQATLTDELLAKLADLKSLRTVILSDTSFSDAQIQALEKIKPQLTSLDLRGCALSNKATATIARFTALRALRFSGKNGKTTIDDSGLKALAACKSLKVLALDDLWIGSEGLESLSGLADLEELYLAGTVVDDSSMTLVTKYPKLKKLRLASTQVSDDGLAALSARTTLEELDLSSNSLITNAGLVHLAKLTGLKKLNLWKVQISDAGIQLLAPLNRLEWLNLDQTMLTDAGLPVLKGMMSLTFLHLGSTRITAAGAPALFHLKGLKDLKITRTALGSSETAVAELQKNLPSTMIQTEYVEPEQ